MLKVDLTRGSEQAHLRRMTIPMIWGLLSIMSMNLADTFFVAQLGAQPLAAMGFTFPVISIIYSLAFGVGAANSSLIARAIGAKQTDLVKGYATQSLFIAVILAMLFSIAGLLSIDGIFTMLGAKPDLLPFIHQYMDIWYLGCLFIIMPIVGNSAIRAAGNTRLPSIVMMTVAVVNVLLDPLFIFGGFGFPALGLQGAALATIVAYIIAFSVSIYILRVRLQFIALRHLTQSIVSIWSAILRLAIPAMMSNIVAPVSAAIATALVAGYGSDAVAGFGVASRIEMMFLVVIIALSSIMGPFSGQNWGAGEKRRLQRALSLSYRFAFYWCFMGALILYIFANDLVSLFNIDSMVEESAVSYLMIVPASYFFLACVMMASSLANGVGKPLPALIMSSLRLLVLYIPIAILFSQYWGLMGLYWATALANIIVGMGAWYWSRRLCAVGVAK